MPKFTTLNPAEVTVGRGRGAQLAREPYLAAIREYDAGKIELERGERWQTVKRLLQSAAKEAGMRLRSSYVEAERALYWKKVQGQR